MQVVADHWQTILIILADDCLRQLVTSDTPFTLDDTLIPLKVDTLYRIDYIQQMLTGVSRAHQGFPKTDQKTSLIGDLSFLGWVLACVVVYC